MCGGWVGHGRGICAGGGGYVLMPRLCLPRSCPVSEISPSHSQDFRWTGPLTCDDGMAGQKRNNVTAETNMQYYSRGSLEVWTRFHSIELKVGIKRQDASSCRTLSTLFYYLLQLQVVEHLMLLVIAGLRDRYQQWKSTVRKELTQALRALMRAGHGDHSTLGTYLTYLP